MTWHAELPGSELFFSFDGRADRAETTRQLARRWNSKSGSIVKRSLIGAPKDDGRSWLELSVYDVTGALEPDSDPIPDDESLMCAMDENNFAARFIAEQSG